MNSMNYVKSPLNYTGGKYKLLPQIIPLFPTDNIRYFVDMFAGGANISANVKADKIIANDLDNKIIELYKFLQTMSIQDILAHIDKRIKEFALTINNKEGYNKFRDYYNNSQVKNPIDFFILICYSFNHQIRFNKYGKFNMPFGMDRSYFNNTIRNNLIRFHNAIKNIDFENKDFRDIDISKLNKEDFIYADPPYLITCASYNENGGWNEQSEKDLLRLLDEANNRGVRFALSNVLVNKGRKNDILINWAKKYNIHHLNYTYSNCNYHSKDKSVGTTDEVLITNY